ncbi:hypothetical protein [Microvirga flavescens]|uniref:hypothetical protein n=1 Tax=Microvirga flavescens TaxID=2249811 RepID=UPI000DD590C1|nr:hypothetical protein [Microvirga flavescens]
MGQTNKPLNGRRRANPFVVVLALVYALAGLPHAAMALSMTMNCHPQNATAHHAETGYPAAGEAHDHAPAEAGKQQVVQPCCGLWCAGVVVADVRAVEPVMFVRPVPVIPSGFSSRTMEPEPRPPRLV